MGKYEKLVRDALRRTHFVSLKTLARDTELTVTQVRNAMRSLSTRKKTRRNGTTVYSIYR